MERHCFTFELVPGQEAEYQRRHDAIWPELVAEIEAAGVSNYTLFRRGATVIAYCECEPDAATAFGKLAESEVNRRWAEWFDDVIERLADADGKPFTADEVWHLEGGRLG
jgi:L-rhamnose mutarotase